MILVYKYIVKFQVQLSLCKTAQDVCVVSL